MTLSIYNMNMNKVEVFISGGGIAGLTLSLLLAKSGIKTAIIDPNFSQINKNIEQGTRTAAVMTSLLTIYEEIGILSDIKGYSSPLKHLRLIDAPSRHFQSQIERIFDATEINTDAFSWNIPNSLLLNSLYKQAQKTKHLLIIKNDKIDTIDITTSHVSIKTKEKQRFYCSLLVGADGRNSFVRQQSNIKATITPTNQTAITAILSHTKHHKNTSTEIHKGGGPFTMVPLSKNLSSLVWIEKTEKIDKILSQKKTEITHSIQTLSQNILGKITLQSKIESFPINTLKTNKIIDKRTALIAESAHVLPPTGAQGLNLSLQDIKALHATIIKAKELGSDIGSKSTLEMYSNARKSDIALRTHSTSLLNHFVKKESHIHQAARRFGLTLLSDTSSIRNRIMTHGFQS